MPILGCLDVTLKCFGFHVQLPVQKRKKPGGQKKSRFKTHNHHLAGVLEDYSEGVPVKKGQN